MRPAERRDRRLAAPSGAASSSSAAGRRGRSSRSISCGGRPSRRRGRRSSSRATARARGGVRDARPVAPAQRAGDHDERPARRPGSLPRVRRACARTRSRRGRRVRGVPRVAARGRPRGIPRRVRARPRRGRRGCGTGSAGRCAARRGAGGWIGAARGRGRDRHRQRAAAAAGVPGRDAGRRRRAVRRGPVGTRIARRDRGRGGRRDHRDGPHGARPRGVAACAATTCGRVVALSRHGDIPRSHEEPVATAAVDARDHASRSSRPSPTRSRRSAPGSPAYPLGWRQGAGLAAARSTASCGWRWTTPTRRRFVTGVPPRVGDPPLAAGARR